MIQIGMSTWADHPSLSVEGKEKSTLDEYAGHFPVVEVDSSFYAIPSLSNIVNWQHQVPENFKFIFKASRVMTLHDANDDEEYLTPERRMEFTSFRKVMQPLINSQQLESVLFQFPPSFRCDLTNIRYLFEIREMMGNLPIAVEFRNSSWFTKALEADTISYLERLNMINVTVDEPFDGNLGMPLVLQVTSTDKAMFRLHGRNAKGWFNSGKEWRRERTNYRYSTDELNELAKWIKAVAEQVSDVTVIFNNNGNHDAVDNGEELQEILGLHFEGLGPVQMDLF
ncbi:DUF72 domain-containing protein [Pediococcus stilesii]|uniref:DUF72 domain-containing protein n=1 Tax=Pediococcus stilesii TaxID=331679 RepID=A0A5R9BSE0_9LACO|nr:DUF72 domain-containing protein [Pediococcus stilesii]TLQ03594.1 DUF72 domain-containing protein [Pediococcus stilesii]